MATHHDCISLFRKSFYLTFLIVVVIAKKECDQTKCPGPLRYYKDLGCTPVYEKPGDCCPVEYNCDHLQGRAKNKCYVNGHAYNIGEALRKKDSNPCDRGCICQQGRDGVAKFSCAILDCYYGSTEPNCYWQRTPAQCCPGPQVCLKKGEKRPVCEVDGKIYMDGEYFKPKSNPELDCYCGPGYTGKNVAPFCRKPNRPHCAVDFRYPSQVYRHCAPVYNYNQSPQTDCNNSFRCQKDDENESYTVIHNHADAESSASHEQLEDKLCVYGNMTLHLNDELRQSTDPLAKCVKCVCEVPPVLTCVRLSDEECKTNPPFNR